MISGDERTPKPSRLTFADFGKRLTGSALKAARTLSRPAIRSSGLPGDVLSPR